MASVRTTTHDITIAAPPRSVYDLIADASAWPQHFRPNVHVQCLERTSGPDATTERIRIWATANDEVKDWTSRRALDVRRLRVSFRQEVSRPPVAEMGGEWIVTATDDGGTRLELRHDFRAVDDDPAGVDWILRALDHNSATELAGLKAAAERWDRLDESMFSFEDTVRTQGSADDVYDYLDRADLWPDRLPHVARLTLTEDVPGVQRMAMDTRAPDGDLHTTESIRICFPRERRIVYKQTTVPALMAAHTGRWSVAETPDGVDVTSRHTVVLEPSAVESVLGAGRTLADARAFVRRALGTNSTTTMVHAGRHAEALRTEHARPQEAHRAG